MNIIFYKSSSGSNGGNSNPKRISGKQAAKSIFDMMLAVAVIADPVLGNALRVLPSQVSGYAVMLRSML